MSTVDEKRCPSISVAKEKKKRTSAAGRCSGALAPPAPREGRTRMCAYDGPALLERLSWGGSLGSFVFTIERNSSHTSKLFVRASRKREQVQQSGKQTKKSKNAFKCNTHFFFCLSFFFLRQEEKEFFFLAQLSFSLFLFFQR